MALRSSGVLMHPTSLPGPFGIGDLGPSAYRFADFLSRGRQQLWQMLPLNPTIDANGHSPYGSPSTFAGNPLLISPRILQIQGWLEAGECPPLNHDADTIIPYDAVTAHKMNLLLPAAQRIVQHPNQPALDHFIRQNRFWLDDFALFRTLDRHFGTPTWCDWPDGLRDHDPTALAAARNDFAEAIAIEKALQFFFYQQWQALRRYCRGLGIRLFGDMPIYVPLHSADVWANRSIFKLDTLGRPTHVSGVPPDYFSNTGQRWGHPVYDWDRMRASGYRWWQQRLAMHMSLFDLIRIDHFRGLVAYWEVPARERTALNGTWQPAPATELLALIQRRRGFLPVVAEDLGIIDAQVREVIRHFDLPGMRVLQFAFGDDFPYGSFLPHHYVRHCVAYTGTHDNNTTAGWLDDEADAHQRRRLFSYIGRETDTITAVWECIRLVMQSAADTVIVPMQDLLTLGPEARMNRPAAENGNWRWRMTQTQLTHAPVRLLAEITHTCARDYPEWPRSETA